ncbi:MAG: TIGR03435 family protein [Candidatus Solibacter sp.]|nr:TIGR03435 family protein [Candidatus Solibacter sp.]
MQRAILGAGLIIFTSWAAFGQAAAESPTFEVASVKPAEPPPAGMMRVMMRGGPGTADPGQLTYSNVSLKNVLMNAYGVMGYQISGPKWLDSERFDIVAFQTDAAGSAGGALQAGTASRDEGTADVRAGGG